MQQLPSSSNSQPSVCAVLAAAGIGTRFQADSPKQFTVLLDRPIYQWSLLTLAQHPDIKHIVITTLPDWIDGIEQQIKRLKEVKEVTVIGGGDTRQESVFNALKLLSKQPPDFVLIHDAARPFLTEEIINDTIYAVKKYGACTVCLQASDTIKKIDENVIIETLDRQEIVQVQTPQAARFDWLFDAHKKATTDGIATTDDAALLEQAGHKVVTVKGSRFNLKITDPEDLILAQSIAGLLFARKEGGQFLT